MDILAAQKPSVHSKLCTQKLSQSLVVLLHGGKFASLQEAFVFRVQGIIEIKPVQM